ncbi:AarF/ABC1/UbiB kinase family protein [Chitinibacter sp. GC72]|uniref:ABC1 kinase family protein n=1 Tax=Chitinibacter sp. GC72 TaxID=1526917 RepID=UPI0012F748A1|nr:AarF/ABC1/UbiB kinase family protein [Chitinibacter sp. GC72]
MRRDLIPEQYANELALLHDQLPAMPFDLVRSIIEAEFGLPLTKLFSEFSEAPLGAASIAQVHKATTLDGRVVAVKVQRPNLNLVISKDIALLTHLISLGEMLMPQLRSLELHRVVNEFALSLQREIDFTHEARSILIFRAAMSECPELWVPDVLNSYSRGAVLTMTFSEGERIDLYAQKHPEKMPEAMNSLLRLMLKTIFENGLFHADPHPGNVFVLPDGRLALLDFGNTGELDEPMRESLAYLLEAVIAGDARAASEAYLEMALSSDEVDRAALQMDMKAALYEIRRSDLNAISIGATFEALTQAGTRNRVRNPNEFVLLTRAVLIMESMIEQLAPNHDYIASFREQISRLTTLHFSKQRIADKTTRLARELERLMLGAPSDTRRILRRVAEGNLGRLPRLESMGERLSRNLERLAGAIAYAALVISGSMLLLTAEGDWHHTLGEIMIGVGIFGMAITGIGVLRSRHTR